MKKDYIDMAYREVSAQEAPNETEVVVNADPFSTWIHEMFGIVNNVTNAVKEYNLCRLQEETRRAEIHANLKIELAQIDAQKALLMQQIDYHHALTMEHIRNVHELVMKELDVAIEATRSAIKIAQETHDCSAIVMMLECMNKMVETRTQFTLQQMQQTTSNAAIPTFQPKGYLNG